MDDGGKSYYQFFFLTNEFPTNGVSEEKSHFFGFTRQ